MIGVESYMAQSMVSQPEAINLSSPEDYQPGIIL